MEYKQSNFSVQIDRHIAIPEMRTIFQSEEEEKRERITNFNTFLHQINEIINNFEGEANEKSAESAQKLEETTAFLIHTLEISLPAFFMNPDFNDAICGSELIKLSIAFVGDLKENISENTLTNILHFLAIVSSESEPISFCICQEDFFPIFFNQGNFATFTEKQIVHGIEVANNIIKKCDLEFLEKLRSEGFVDLLLSLIQRDALDQTKEELDTAIAVALSNYFDRVFKEGDESCIELAISFFMTFLTLHPTAKEMIIYLVFNLLNCINPITGKPILSIKDFLNIRLGNGAVFINEILSVIGNISYNSSVVATKLAIFFFSKNVLSPKKYYLIALNIPWSLLTENKITFNDELSELVIKLIITIVSIDLREVDQKFRPEQSFLSMVSSTRFLSRITENIDKLNYGNRVAAIQLFHLIMIMCKPIDCPEIIDQGIVRFALDQLEIDDKEIPPIVIDGMIALINKAIMLDEQYYRKIVDIANEIDVNELLIEFKDSEFSDKAYTLYNMLGYDDGD